MAVCSLLSAVLFIAVASKAQIIPYPDIRKKVSDVEWESFRLLNEVRRTGYTCPNGAKYEPNSRRLLFDCRLWRASYLHSEDMAKQGYFSHTSKDGRSPWDRARAQSGGVSIANGENIAINSVQALGAIEAWKRSDGHCRNMMNPSFTSMGVGSYQRHWTQMLGRQNANQVDTSCYPDAPAPPTPGPTATPIPSPTPNPADGFSNVAEFKAYCQRLGDDQTACQACGGKYVKKKQTCKLAKNAKKVKCKKVKNDDVCSKLGCGSKNGKCNGKPTNIQ